MIWGFIGPEGSGKTLAMTYMAVLHHRDGGAIKTFPGYKIQNPRGKIISQEVDFRQMFTDLHSFRNTIVCADEIQNFMDAKMSMSVFSRLMGYVAAQRRKSNLGIMYTVQDWGWLFNRFRQLTHLLTICKDLHNSPWGRENKVQRGCMISLTTYDLKGFFTGTPWTLLSRKTLAAKAIWNYYDSYAAVDIFEGMRKYEIKKDVEVFDLRPPREEYIPSDDIDDTSSLDILQGLAAEGISPSMLGKIGRKMQK